MNAVRANFGHVCCLSTHLSGLKKKHKSQSGQPVCRPKSEPENSQNKTEVLTTTMRNSVAFFARQQHSYDRWHVRYDTRWNPWTVVIRIKISSPWREVNTGRTSEAWTSLASNVVDVRNTASRILNLCNTCRHTTSFTLRPFYSPESRLIPWPFNGSYGAVPLNS